MICEYCGKEFEGKRSDARYCSDKCRQYAKRGVTDKVESVTDKLKSVTDKLKLVTDKSRDDIWSESYDTSEAGFKRRNKAWDSLGQSFKTNLMARCIRINADHVRDRMECIAMREKIATACR